MPDLQGVERALFTGSHVKKVKAGQVLHGQAISELRGATEVW